MVRLVNTRSKTWLFVALAVESMVMTLPAVSMAVKYKVLMQAGCHTLYCTVYDKELLL